MPGMLRKPAAVLEDAHFEPWFRALGTRLLNDFDFLIGGLAHRIVELEFYYHTAGHLDPFSHRNPLQQRAGFWCFHRSGAQYRGGSFKGLDISCGSGQDFGGILIRTIETPAGKLIDGPSLCVDHLLARTGAARVADLDQLIAGRSVFDNSSILFLRPSAVRRPAAVYSSARVGLTLRRAALWPDMPRYLMRPYRFLTEPRRVRKGKSLLALELHRQGMTIDAIHDLTGSPRKSIERYFDPQPDG